MWGTVRRAVRAGNPVGLTRRDGTFVLVIVQAESRRPGDPRPIAANEQWLLATSPRGCLHGGIGTDTASPTANRAPRPRIIPLTGSRATERAPGAPRPAGP